MRTETNQQSRDQQWRVIGNWSATDADNGQPKSGQVNYGFDTEDKALSCIANLCNIAMRNDMYVRTEFARLDVSADRWSNMRNFQGHYRVTQKSTN